MQEKRYAAAYIYVYPYGYVRQHFIIVSGGTVKKIAPLTEELEDTSWLTGSILLLPSDWPSEEICLTEAQQKSLNRPIEGEVGQLQTCKALHLPDTVPSNFVSGVGIRHTPLP